MDWTAASVIVSAIGIIVTIVIASRSANKELRHNRFLQERDIAIRLLHENEFDPEWLAAKRAITADTALRLARYFGSSEKFWLGLQGDYDLEEANKKMASCVCQSVGLSLSDMISNQQRQRDIDH